LLFYSSVSSRCEWVLVMWVVAQRRLGPTVSASTRGACPAALVPPGVGDDVTVDDVAIALGQGFGDVLGQVAERFDDVTGGFGVDPSPQRCRCAD